MTRFSVNYSVDRRQMLLLRDGPNCWNCGAEFKVSPWHEVKSLITIDHLLPQAYGGTDAISNQVLSCRECNLNKNCSFSERDKAKCVELRAFHESIGFGLPFEHLPCPPPTESNGK